MSLCVCVCVNGCVYLFPQSGAGWNIRSFFACVYVVYRDEG